MKKIIAIILLLVLVLGLCACTSNGYNKSTDVNGWLIFAAIVVLIVQFFFAVVFGGIAEDKGYSQTGYFWICFLFGVTGYCLVAALPDKKLRDYCTRLAQDDKYDLPISNGGVVRSKAVRTKNGWICSCGRKNADYVSTCFCGANKTDIK